jgi:hypothetical protein
VGEHTYLIRYGVMGQVGRFTALPECDAPFERGQVVVIQSHRGLELGEVLFAHDGPAPGQSGGDDGPAGPDGDRSRAVHRADRPHVLRLAGIEDLARSRRAEELRPSRFATCRRVLEEEHWPWELIEVEPLLDGCATVLHYLGPHHLDVGALRARFRVLCDLDVVLEPAGPELDGDAARNLSREDGAHGGCGSCDCGSSDGCSSGAALEEDRGAPDGSPDANRPAPAAHGGCASCGIRGLLEARGRSRDSRS